jgi:hypothetical protein
VRDNLGLSDDQRTNITVPYDTAHVGDLDGTSAAQQNVWNATVTITVHDSRHAVVSNALVTGLWNDGTSGTCTTNAEVRRDQVRDSKEDDERERQRHERQTPGVRVQVRGQSRPAAAAGPRSSSSNHRREQQEERRPHGPQAGHEHESPAHAFVNWRFREQRAVRHGGRL